MNDENTQDGQLADDGFSDAYRKASRETVPDSLNQRILRQAKNAAKRPWHAAWSSQFTRPLAFAALFVLSLALLLQINDVNMDGLSESEGFARKPVQAGGIEGSAAAQQIESAAANSVEHVRQQTGRHAATNQNQGSASDADAAASSCNEARTKTRDLWLACIEQLEKDGQLSAARQERDRLRQAFPPEN